MKRTMKRMACVAALAAVVAMLSGTAGAALCPKCADMMFTTDIGTCGNCGGDTSSGAFGLCPACSAKLDKCQACGAALTPTAEPEKADKAGRPEPQVITASIQFAVDLYPQLAGKEGNVFFSPSSIHTALSMTYTGARGQTQRQMAEVLGLLSSSGEDAVPQPVEQISRQYKGFLAALRAPENVPYKLHTANAIYGQEGFDWSKPFLRTLDEQFGAPLEQVDFQADAEAARKKINGWVEDQTKDRIKDLFPEGLLDESTRLVLVSAIYFKGKWESPFDKEATKDAPFHMTTDQTVKVPMMHQQNRFGYVEHRDAQVLAMPYQGGELSMVVILPKAKDGLSAIEKKLPGKPFDEWTAGLENREVRVFLPRFTMTCEYKLKDTLSAMGMAEAFDASKADFSGMDGRKDLFISAVVHKAFVEVNEEGTEAAAATGVSIRPTAEMPKTPPVFRADHPFLFAIRHNGTGAILFMGRVMNPSQ